VSRIDDWWATRMTVRAAKLISLERLDELDDAALLELHTTIMRLRHRVVTVQRHRRSRSGGARITP
jgi:hypothetical protein